MQYRDRGCVCVCVCVCECERDRDGEGNRVFASRTLSLIFAVMDDSVSDWLQWFSDRFPSTTFTTLYYTIDKVLGVFTGAYS